MCSPKLASNSLCSTTADHEPSLWCPVNFKSILRFSTIGSCHSLEYMEFRIWVWRKNYNTAHQETEGTQSSNVSEKIHNPHMDTKPVSPLPSRTYNKEWCFFCMLSLSICCYVVLQMRTSLQVLFSFLEKLIIPKSFPKTPPPLPHPSTEVFQVT